MLYGILSIIIVLGVIYHISYKNRAQAKFERIQHTLSTERTRYYKEHARNKKLEDENTVLLACKERLSLELEERE